MSPLEQNKQNAADFSDATYELVVGKVKTTRNHCREAVISLIDKKAGRQD